MMTALRRFYRRNFCPVAKAKFLDLFEENTDMLRAVVLVETSPLAGIRSEYVWQEFTGIGRLVVRELDLRTKTETTIANQEVEAARIGNVIRRIEEAGGNSLGNFSGKIIDGVFYSLCWGSPSNMFILDIANPQFGSKRHETLIALLKACARETN